MELEKIRAADTSVRWQDDEDVDNCPSCKNNFTVTRRKVCHETIFIHCIQSLKLNFLSFKIAKLSSLWNNLL